jgi:homoserine O-succinyltransferase
VPVVLNHSPTESVAIPEESHLGLRLALVNNMPKAAREDTQRQLLGLVQRGRGDLAVEAECYQLNPADLDRLENDSPDVVIVTGTEPSTELLTDEPYWPEMARLLRWAPAATTSVLLSCLAAHAALLLNDGLVRVPTSTKCHGVFDNEVRGGHPLTAGLAPRVAFPHSRGNGVPTGGLESAGWEILLRADGAEWTVAARMEGNCRVVLAQGHPEYEADTLLREYRRDIRRFKTGARSSYPTVPVGYLDPDGMAIVTAYRKATLRADQGRTEATLRADQGRTEATLRADQGRTEDFPFDTVARGIAYGWRQPAEQLFSNWLADAALRSAPKHRR